jgi:hypothetical protein
MSGADHREADAFGKGEPTSGLEPLTCSCYELASPPLLNPLNTSFCRLFFGAAD